MLKKKMTTMEASIPRRKKKMTTTETKGINKPSIPRKRNCISRCIKCHIFAIIDHGSINTNATTKFANKEYYRSNNY